MARQVECSPNFSTASCVFDELQHHKASNNTWLQMLSSSYLQEACKPSCECMSKPCMAPDQSLTASAKPTWMTSWPGQRLCQGTLLFELVLRQTLLGVVPGEFTTPVQPSRLTCICVQGTWEMSLTSRRTRPNCMSTQRSQSPRGTRWASLILDSMHQSGQLFACSPSGPVECYSTPLTSAAGISST